MYHTANADEYLRVPNEDWRVTPEYTAITAERLRVADEDSI